MKRIVFMAAILAVLALSHSAFAAGVGVYVEGGGATVSWSENIKKGGAGNGTGHVGGGIIVDSCLAVEKIFNYRLNIGYGQLFAGRQFSRINMVHTFGIAAVRSNMVRFWLGPQIGFGYVFGKYSFTSFEDAFGAFIMGQLVLPPNMRELYVLSQAAPKSKSLSAGDLHAGVALGVNINLAGGLTLAFEGGFRIGTHVATGKTVTTSTPTSKSTSTQLKGLNAYYGGYFSVGVLYRPNEPLPL